MLPAADWERAMSPEQQGAMIEACAAAIEREAETLTALDQAIGDGDHGLNMRRGFQALREQQAELAALPVGQMLQKAGMTLVMKIGGASGPLYGSLFMAMGKAAPSEVGGGRVDGRAAAIMLAAGIAAVKARGKAEAGEKTMLDVLIPVQETLQAELAAGSGRAALLRALATRAAAAAEATKPLQATKGRASFLGERSVGHVDPGARSSALLVATLCDQLAGD
jgi:dihydroxyacetone kinase-like protein